MTQRVAGTVLAPQVSDAKAGAAALEDAKKILTDFYEASKTAEVPVRVFFFLSVLILMLYRSSMDWN